MNTAYLALGSNLGERERQLAEALRRLQSDADVQVTQTSSLYETAPVGVTDQPDFLNLVVEARTSLSAESLLAHALTVEAALGRVRRERWGPRVIDIDLLWFEGQKHVSPGLTLPHPRMLERAFVIIPLSEIAPRLTLEGETVASRATQFIAAGVKRLGRLAWDAPDNA